MPATSGDQDDDAQLWDQIANEALRIEEAILQSRATDGTPPALSSFSEPSVVPRPPRRPVRQTPTLPTLGTPATLTGQGAPISLDGGSGRLHGRPPLSNGRSASPHVPGRTAEDGLVTNTSETNFVSSHISTIGEDSFSRLLRAKDSELQRIRFEKDGEISNLRHRMRAISSQLETRAKATQTGPQHSKYPAEKLEGVMEERARLAKDAAIAENELKRVSEQLAFARQEINALKDSQRKLTMAAARPSPEKQSSSEFPAPGTLGAASLPGNAAADVPWLGHTQGNATQQGSEFVENTQAGGRLVHSARFAGYEMPKGPRPPRRRRPPSSSDPASSGTPNRTTATATYDVTQDMSPSHSFPRAHSPGNEIPHFSAIYSAPQSEPCLDEETGIQASDTMHKRSRSRDEEADVQIVWETPAKRFGEGSSANLRSALFGCGKAERLLNICSYAGKTDLRRAVAHAMENEYEWTTMLVPMVDLCTVGGGVSVLGMEMICVLLEHSASCRRECVVNRSYRIIADTALKVLEESTQTRDGSLACFSLRALSCLVSETLLLSPCHADAGDASDGVVESSESKYASGMRQLLEHEAVLVWLQQQNDESTDACCIAAEVASELILNVVGTTAEQDEREGDFLEQALLCFAAALSQPSVDKHVKTLALCSLDWASQTSIYFLHEKDARVIESLCLFCIEAVHRMRLQAFMCHQARDAFCELIHDHVESIPRCWRTSGAIKRTESTVEEEAEIAAIARAVCIARRLAQNDSQGASLVREVSGTTRNLALSMLAFLGWPGSTDCYVGLSHTRKPDAISFTHHETDALAVNSRALFEVLACSDPDM
jgi:hypothetical protein